MVLPYSMTRLVNIFITSTALTLSLLSDSLYTYNSGKSMNCLRVKKIKKLGNMYTIILSTCINL